MRNTIENRVLDGLRRWAGVEEGGWHVGESALAEGLTHPQISNALQRLRRKGAAYSVEARRPHAGNRRRWLWFPAERT